MNNNMGRIIAEYRNKNNWTQEDLANELCVSNKTISKWECGMGYPDLHIIPKIAKLFNITTDLLFYGKVINNDLVFHEKKDKDSATLPKFTSDMYEAQSHLWTLLQALDRIRHGKNYKNEQCFQKLNKRIQAEFPNCFVIDWDTISEIWWEA